MATLSTVPGAVRKVSLFKQSLKEINIIFDCLLIASKAWDRLVLIQQHGILPENLKSIGCSAKKLLVLFFITRVVWGNHDVKLCRCVAKDYELPYFLHKKHTEKLKIVKINWKTMANIVDFGVLRVPIPHLFVMNIIL